mmetsp:Transcript_13893/g.23028  ORF Transcript_13893/g.23028 Transcript_13893/m.23028 type:complete len:220 (+) Transcript_13893:450-1109(+)
MVKALVAIEHHLEPSCSEGGESRVFPLHASIRPPVRLLMRPSHLVTIGSRGHRVGVHDGLSVRPDAVPRTRKGNSRDRYVDANVAVTSLWLGRVMQSHRLDIPLLSALRTGGNSRRLSSHRVTGEPHSFLPVNSLEQGVSVKICHIACPVDQFNTLAVIGSPAVSRWSQRQNSLTIGPRSPHTGVSAAHNAAERCRHDEAIGGQLLKQGAVAQNSSVST